MNPKISILIPFYRGNKYIQATVNSIYSAMDKSSISYEIIVINDSPELKIELDISNNGNLFLFQNDSNMGIAQTRNIAFSKSRGDYVLFLDQDDLLSLDFRYIIGKEKLDKALYILNISIFNEEDNTIKQLNNKIFWPLFGHMSDRSLMRFGPVFRTVSQMLFRREYFEEFISSKQQGADDYFFYISLIRNCSDRGIKYINNPVVLYRIHSSNYSKVANFYGSLFEIYQKYNNIHDNRYKNDYKYFISRNLFVLAFRRAMIFLTRK